MAYFPNGSAGLGYQEVHCFKCANWRDKNDGRGPGCAVWDAHLMHSYRDCNNKDSILHMLIPRNEDGSNAECEMFMPAPLPAAR